MTNDVTPAIPNAAAGDAEVVTWRREQLLRAGFGAVLADQLACNCTLDLHELIELVERGCKPTLAVRILAPLNPHDRRPC